MNKLYFGSQPHKNFFNGSKVCMPVCVYICSCVWLHVCVWVSVHMHFCECACVWVHHACSKEHLSKGVAWLVICHLLKLLLLFTALRLCWWCISLHQLTTMSLPEILTDPVKTVLAQLLILLFRHVLDIFF